MNRYNIYLTVIVSVKVMFLILAMAHVYLTIKGEEKSETDQKIEYWKEKIRIYICSTNGNFIYLFI